MKEIKIENPETSFERLGRSRLDNRSRNSSIGIQAMVVDNNPDALYASADMLNRLGYSVCTYGTSVDALFHAAHNEMALFLIEIGMPEINGYQLGRQVKSQFPKARVVIMCAVKGGVSPEQLGDHAIDGWLFKPILLKNLMGVLIRAGLPIGLLEAPR